MTLLLFKSPKTEKNLYDYVENRERCLFSFCHERGTKKRIVSPHEESHLRSSDFAIRCSTTEPQRLHGERGLLRSSQDPLVFVDCLPTHENVMDVPFFNLRSSPYILFAFFLHQLSVGKQNQIFTTRNFQRLKAASDSVSRM